MSRRHREKEAEITITQRHAGSLDDSSVRVMLDADSSLASNYLDKHLKVFNLFHEMAHISVDNLICGATRIFEFVRRTSFDIQQKSLDYSFDDIPEHLRNTFDGKYLAQLVEQVANTEILEMEEPSMEELKNTNGRGRPMIEQMSSFVSDNKVCSWAKTIYRKIYKKSIAVAKNVTQYCVCFLCSFFKIYDTEEPYGRITHFWRIMKGSIPKMPTARAIQKYYSWFVSWKAAAIKTVAEIKEETKHRAWEKLERLIYGYLLQLAPQVAMP